MKTERKARQASLAEELKRATGPEAHAIKELLALMLEDATDNLVLADGDDILRRQGEARGFARILVMLTRATPEMQARTPQE